MRDLGTMQLLEEQCGEMEARAHAAEARAERAEDQIARLSNRVEETQFEISHMARDSSKLELAERSLLFFFWTTLRSMLTACGRSVDPSRRGPLRSLPLGVRRQPPREFAVGML